MIGWLATAIITTALLLAVWGGVAAALDRAPNRWLFVGVTAVEVLVVAQAGIAVAKMLGGVDVDAALLTGYLLSAVLLPPGAVALARMEPTRWGSAIVGASGLVLAPLILRLLQIWEVAS